MPGQFDDRDLVGDNTEGVEHYVGVDPVYQNYANEGEKPHPFHQEEIERLSREAGIPEGRMSGYAQMLLDAPGVGEDEEGPEGGTPDDGDTGSSPASAPVIPPAPKS